MTLHDHTHNVHVISAVATPLRAQTISQRPWALARGRCDRAHLGLEFLEKFLETHLAPNSACQLSVKRAKTLVYDAFDSFSHLV
jgi:hypothetical protein